MALNANKIKSTGKGGDMVKPLLDAGGYPGRIVQVIDLGLHVREFQGEAKAPAREIRVTYELSDEFMQDKDGNPIEDKPLWFAEDFPLHSLKSEKAKSTIRYRAIDPNNSAAGDWASLIGYPCMVALVQNPGRGKNAGEIYNNVGGIGAIRPKDAAKLPKLVNASTVFDLDDPDLEIFKALPSFVQDKIKANLEYNGSELQKLLGEKAQAEQEVKPAEDDLDDEIPF